MCSEEKTSGCSDQQGFGKPVFDWIPEDGWDFI